MTNNESLDTNNFDKNINKKETNVVLQILAFFISSAFISILIFALIPNFSSIKIEDSEALTWLVNRFFSSSISLIATITVSILCIKRFTQRTTYSLGYLPHKWFLRDFFVGCLISLLMVSIIALFQWLLGGTQFFWALSDRKISLLGLTITFIVIFIAAFEEEVIFRGYPLQTLAFNLSPLSATIITSTFFGLVHINNPSATFFSTTNTILAGVWLCVAYFKTRSLSLATGLHLSWNFSMGTIYGLPVSGITELKEFSFLNSQDLGKAWLTGSSYGPEGGATTTLVLLLGIILLIKLPILKISPEMAQCFPEKVYLPKD
ncbi:MAG: CPBP family intramembrane metalloprotease [Acidobacteria bacterium]|nr:CPBP family intramembrane metalloprotease [Acidobacteriota bacterium]